ncbi:LysE family transporter [Nodosilinea sp. LEGE 07088]|uniref:LysE family translocator n=1 Tax=Nodosilinea sp. LEGE 07088 TaxID=2777968 RepID=UPI0018817DA3|nr:LysE family transporter [Nodosilinea sp. LEGE 07088]MBE9138917.1 LysE family transporter [Nodosilinea sp. LEGE 07088]
MPTSLSLSTLLALFTALVVLAAVPGVSSLAVATQSATYGLSYGLFVTLGIVIGDGVLIAIALGGLALIATAPGNLTVLLQVAAGVYLIILGIGLYRWRSRSINRQHRVSSSRLSSFLLGLSITLGDQKATLFYLGFFPTFLDVAALSWLDAAILWVTTVVAVGGVKVGYALLGDRAGNSLSPQLRQGMTAIASAVVIMAGCVLILKA